MDDRTAQFYVIVGTICDDARVANMAVRVLLRDGRDVVGVPGTATTGGTSGDELDDTGVRRVISVDSHVIRLEDITEISLVVPAA